MGGRIQKVVVNGSMSVWRSVTNAVTLGSVLGPVLFNIFVSDMDSGTKCIFSKSADDTKMSSAIDMPEGLDVIQMDLDKLEKWAYVNFMRFNKAKCKVPHLGQGNPQYQCSLGDEGIESSPQCIKRGIASRLREGILPLHSALVKAHLESCVQLWSPQHRKGMELLEWVQSSATKMARGMENLSYEERLREWGLFSLEKTRLWGNLIAAFQYLMSD